jgi:N-acetylmuramoyl-L-alanine amidase
LSPRQPGQQRNLRANYLCRVLAVLILFSCQLVISGGMAFAADVKATASRVVGDDNRTRFIADISKPVSYSVYVLPDPYRVIIDLPGVSFDLPPGVGKKVRGLVTEYRYGQIEDGKSRIVLDTKGPVLIEKSYLVEAKNGQPARIVVDLLQTSEVAFQKSFAKDNPDSLIAEAPPVEESAAEPAPIEEAAAAPEPAPEPTEPPAEPKAKDENHKLTIVLDPGHGGIDPGASSPQKTKEKTVVLAFAHTLRKALESTGRYNVVMTRTDDTFISLKQRVKVARDNAADLFIAIHADTVRGPAARGATIYTLSDKASDHESEALAQKENDADKIAGIDLDSDNQEINDILMDLVQRESKNHAVFFSKKAVSELKSVTMLTGKPLRSAGFVVLKAPDIPSVLLELGYLSSAADEKLLTTVTWRQRVAEAMATAVDKYFATEIASRAD